MEEEIERRTGFFTDNDIYITSDSSFDSIYNAKHHQNCLNSKQKTLNAEMPPFTGRKKITLANGDIYEGEFFNDLFHGKGKYTSDEGAVYEGDFVNDLPHGKGKFTWTNGNVYEGDFNNGEKNGKGKMTYPDGKVEEGNWRDGEFKGK